MKTEAGGWERFGKREILSAQLARGAAARPPSPAEPAAGWGVVTHLCITPVPHFSLESHHLLKAWCSSLGSLRALRSSSMQWRKCDFPGRWTVQSPVQNLTWLYKSKHSVLCEDLLAWFSEIHARMASSWDHFVGWVEASSPSGRAKHQHPSSSSQVRPTQNYRWTWPFSPAHKQNTGRAFLFK